MLFGLDDVTLLHCPKCNSTNIELKKIYEFKIAGEGFKINRSKKRYVCADCGATIAEPKQYDTEPTIHDIKKG